MSEWKIFFSPTSITREGMKFVALPFWHEGCDASQLWIHCCAREMLFSNDPIPAAKYLSARCQSVHYYSRYWASPTCGRQAPDLRHMANLVQIVFFTRFSPQEIQSTLPEVHWFESILANLSKLLGFDSATAPFG
jgi:hypothetical protein